MQSFLDDRQLAPAIKHVLQGSAVRCAVAFWGNGAAGALFDERGLPEDAKIICEIGMGCSNPDELTKLGAPNNPKLKFMAGLHAKVYISSKGLVVGSANASDNGIGFFKSAKLIEAGTFHEPESETYKQGAEWFERTFQGCKQIDTEALERAGRLWRARPPSRRAPESHEQDPASLLDAVVTDPQRFRGVGFVFTFGRATKEQRDEAAKAIISEDGKSSAPLLSKEQKKAIRSWPLGNVFSGWDTKEIWAWPQKFICVHLNRLGRPTYWPYKRAIIYFANTA
jgi:hypothetical protein